MQKIELFPCVSSMNFINQFLHYVLYQINTSFTTNEFIIWMKENSILTETFTERWKLTKFLTTIVNLKICLNGDLQVHKNCFDRCVWTKVDDRLKIGIFPLKDFPFDLKDTQTVVFTMYKAQISTLSRFITHSCTWHERDAM